MQNDNIRSIFIIQRYRSALISALPILSSTTFIHWGGGESVAKMISISLVNEVNIVLFCRVGVKFGNK